MKTDKRSSFSLVSKRSFWVFLKSSRGAIAGINTSGADHYAFGGLRNGPQALRLEDRPSASRQHKCKEQRASSYVPPFGTTEDR